MKHKLKQKRESDTEKENQKKISNLKPPLARLWKKGRSARHWHTATPCEREESMMRLKNNQRKSKWQSACFPDPVLTESGGSHSHHRSGHSVVQAMHAVAAFECVRKDGRSDNGGI